ncbi:ABC transporter substrate-binding protein [Halalkalibacter okhensis]|uniref:Iron ABC transporter substrate-binding protein n=1 Tax=Halalkalibacter okhensis TaxID=333138 RepID=A0A0B0IIR8_9BACI|nr:ABC transporter substrate-binding protein [Halalkalibacter okhensis]KHF40762.1 iron ABC transporter substrate-binding protein [Halalkalibacter okhensis]
MGYEFLKKWGLFGLVLMLAMAIITGCGTPEESSQENVNAGEEELVEENQVQPETERDELFPVTIVDDASREVTIESEPETIVSIQASNTEISFALGLGDKVIGVSDYCNYPAEVLDIEKVGAQDMNAELILTLLPDIALVTDYHFNTHPDILEQFEEAGINVIVVGSASSFEDVYQKIDMIASATGSQNAAEEIISDMKERHQAIKVQAEESITDPKKVWVEVSPAPDIFTTGQNTFMHEMLESIQAVNAAEDHEGWVSLTEEEIVQLNPDVIITTYGYYVDNPSGDVLARDGWAEVPAIQNEQVFDVDNDTVTRPGPRLIEGVETLAKLIYPEVFE